MGAEFESARCVILSTSKICRCQLCIAELTLSSFPNVPSLTTLSHSIEDIMAESYQKTGRGGAGNYHSKNNLAPTTSPDLEAQPQSSSSQTQTLSAQKTLPEYAHTGRGGAGNWVQPATLAGLASSKLPTPVSPNVAPNPTYRGGRGGAGNYVDLGEQEKLRQEEEEKITREKAEIEKRVLRDLESGLARPEKAYGGRRAVFETGSVSG